MNNPSINYHLFNSPTFWAQRPHPKIHFIADDFPIFETSDGFSGNFQATFGTPIRFWTDEEFEKLKSLKLVNLSLWPRYLMPEAYDSNCQKLEANGFTKLFTDSTYVIELNSSAHWLGSLPSAQRWKIRKALKWNVQYHKDSVFSPQAIFEFLKKNRESKGYPLSWDFPTLCQVSESGNTLNFQTKVLSYPNGSLAALAVIRTIRTDTLYTFLLADNPFKRQISATASLLYFLIDEAILNNIKYIDLGIASERGIPNEGLTGFKKRISSFSSEKAFYQLEP